MPSKNHWVIGQGDAGGGAAEARSHTISKERPVVRQMFRIR
jgi:hypothetical protein